MLGQYTKEAGFDCASLSEIRLALNSTGNNAKRCVYANPQRAEKHLEAALALGVEALTFDGLEEVQKVHRAHQKRQSQNPPEMILRILVPDSTSSVPLGEKFGAPPFKIEALAQEALVLGLPIVGVSFHCGSGCHDPDTYGVAIRLAKDAIRIIDRVQRPLGIQCRILDIGGGYPGFDGSENEYERFTGGNSTVDVETTEQETTADIASVVTPLLEQLFPQEDNIEIISEPGRYFVEAAFVLCSRIYSVQVEKDENCQEVCRHYYIAQGVQGVFKDALLCGENFVPISLQMDPLQQDHEDICASTVHGPSGEDFDIICTRHELPRLEVGDWLIFDRMGAYTLSIAARSGRLPICYVIGGTT